jgi:hypothetical protein
MAWGSAGWVVVPERGVGVARPVLPVPVAGWVPGRACPQPVPVPFQTVMESVARESRSGLQVSAA